MPAGEKSGNPRTKHHRATRIAEAMRRQGATRKQANKMATATMDREYAWRKGRPRVAAVDMDAHDSRSGQRKTNLTTKRGPSVSGASKPSRARAPAAGKRDTRATGGSGRASAARKPRATTATAAGAPARKRTGPGTRPPRPRTAQGGARRTQRAAT